MKTFEFVIFLNKEKETYLKLKLKKHLPLTNKWLQSVIFKKEHKAISILRIR